MPTTSAKLTVKIPRFVIFMNLSTYVGFEKFTLDFRFTISKENSSPLTAPSYSKKVPYYA
jgi:hypothetical protein